jgi:membrane protease YdiL (CAAX protease family)
MSTFPPPTTAPAGWYPDPTNGGTRYFDGRVWAPIQPVFEEREAHPHLPLAAAIGALGVLVASLLVGRTLGSLVADVGPDVIGFAFAVAIGYGPSVMWAWYVMRRWGGGSPSAVGFKFRWIDLGWGPLTWLSAVASQLVMYGVVVLFHIPITSNVEDVSDPGVTRIYQVATVLAAVVAAPLVEELVFRGVVLRGFLSRLGPVAAIALQGLLFGFAHSDPARGAGNLGLALVLSGVGVALGTSAYLLRRIGPTVIAHAIFNGVVLIIILSGLLDDADKELGQMVGHVAGLLAAVPWL